jgi:hypothetical protein
VAEFSPVGLLSSEFARLRSPVGFLFHPDSYALFMHSTCNPDGDFISTTVRKPHCVARPGDARNIYAQWSGHCSLGRQDECLLFIQAAAGRFDTASYAAGAQAN